MMHIARHNNAAAVADLGAIGMMVRQAQHAQVQQLQRAASQPADASNDAQAASTHQSAVKRGAVPSTCRQRGSNANPQPPPHRSQ